MKAWPQVVAEGESRFSVEGPLTVKVSPQVEDWAVERWGVRPRRERSVVFLRPDFRILMRFVDEFCALLDLLLMDCVWLFGVIRCFVDTSNDVVALTSVPFLLSLSPV